MSWTFYRQDHPNGAWTLFREDERGHQEIFHRQRGWQPCDELWQRRAKGQVDSADRISEAEAEALLETLRGQRAP